MAKKTATIEVYQVWGTVHFCADVFYRGKLLKRVDASEVDPTKAHINGLLEVARQWAHNNGFTHIKASIV